MKEKLLNLKDLLLLHKITISLVVGLLVILIGGFYVYQSYQEANAGPVEEIDLAFDPEGPYALLFPRRDGNAVVLNLKRTSSYNEISYELAYTSDPDAGSVPGATKSAAPSVGGEASVGAIDRGVVGSIDTKEKKGEYEQEILFGTCSKNVCKYDVGVENGTLTLRIRKGNRSYRMVTQWRLQQPDIALGILTSGDNHFSYKVNASREELANVGYTVVNDLTGVPKLLGGKQVVGKVYSLNVPIAKSLMPGEVTIELAERPDASAKIYYIASSGNEWKELETKVDGSKLSANADGAGIFAVLSNK